jgi:hypothetical protein
MFAPQALTLDHISNGWLEIVRFGRPQGRAAAGTKLVLGRVQTLAGGGAFAAVGARDVTRPAQGPLSARPYNAVVRNAASSPTRPLAIS